MLHRFLPLNHSNFRPLVTSSLRVVSEARRAMRLHAHGVFKSASRQEIKH
jgi:hypothetical protein